MNLWLDDERTPPDAYYDVWAKSYVEALFFLESGRVTKISFDHDLGGEKTGFDVAKLIVELVLDGKIDMPVWEIHSENPVGSRNIFYLLSNLEAHCGR